MRALLHTDGWARGSPCDSSLAAWRTKATQMGIGVWRHNEIVYPEDGNVVALIVIIGESFGSLGLLAGFLTRFTAASLAVIMLGATMVHVSHGFFMIWFGQQQERRL